mmetsp:Transcript_74503/g.209146  ORF Transcript_74503/g.209146 Transcript_74503/m.209146 type:complete len:223 (-) Transcript_74503:119-787(-)
MVTILRFVCPQAYLPLIWICSRPRSMSADAEAMWLSKLSKLACWSSAAVARSVYIRWRDLISSSTRRKATHFSFCNSSSKASLFSIDMPRPAPVSTRGMSCSSPPAASASEARMRGLRASSAWKRRTTSSKTRAVMAKLSLNFWYIIRRLLRSAAFCACAWCSRIRARIALVSVACRTASSTMPRHCTTSLSLLAEPIFREICPVSVWIPCVLFCTWRQSWT